MRNWNPNNKSCWSSANVLTDDLNNYNDKLKGVINYTQPQAKNFMHVYYARIFFFNHYALVGDTSLHVHSGRCLLAENGMIIMLYSVAVTGILHNMYLYIYFVPNGHIILCFQLHVFYVLSSMYLGSLYCVQF